ncbi:FliH/SctL family protein [Novosphingobium sp.]|uniref:FliH/SctL family protein n=1 Tax=Novosphingobium sp. TaxID=1874826 RepID=UPI003342D2FA
MSDGATAARSASLAALGAGRSGGFARDHRFGRHAGGGDDTAPDPLRDAYARGFAEGLAAGADAARARAEADDAARAHITTALLRLDDEASAALAERLKQTVLALCQSVLADAACVPEGLARRVAAAAAMFARAGDDRVIRLHPEDLALIHGRLPESWHCDPDPLMDRGAVRVETAGGGVEQGPAQWRAALEEALRTC